MVTSSEEILQRNRTFHHYSLISFKDSYWTLSTKEREGLHKDWLNSLCAAAQNVDIFQATETGIDLIVWSALTADDKGDAARFFDARCLLQGPRRRVVPGGIAVRLRLDEPQAAAGPRQARWPPCE